MRLLAYALFVLQFNIAVANNRPNILLMMADDLGYSDLGCFGGEIDTPAIDSIARDGLQFTRFRATPMCVTSRIALMSGMPMHRAGQHGYAHSMPLAKLLKSAGYRTMMTGKWHGGAPDPRDANLFDRAFGFLGGATDSFVGGKDWFLDRKAFREFDDRFYATGAFADRSIEFMKEAASSDQPFFMYVAFNAPHHPCQAPKQTVQKYQQAYTAGYQAIRQARYEKQAELGLLDPEWQPAPVGNEVRQWDELSDHRRNVEAGRMAAYAAAVDEVDQAVGQMLDYLNQADLADNTLVVFLSDNGGDYSNGSITGDELQIPWLPGANPSSSNGWASVKCTPFRYYKHACHEGGIATPMVLRWPSGVSQKTGTRIDHAVYITDLYPTIVELAGAKLPTTDVGKPVWSPTGQSLLPLLRDGRQRFGSGRFQWYQFSRAWIEDEWKAVQLYEGPWQLFDLKNDRCEAIDLATKFPDRLDTFIAKWKQFATDSGVPGADAVVKQEQLGWGWHRLTRALPHVSSVRPVNGATVLATDVQLTLEFSKPISFDSTSGKTISLYEVSNESEPVWKRDPEPNHRDHGKRKLRFNDLPKLKPGSLYSIRCDPGWVRIDGQPAGPINDGAYWWRFRLKEQRSNVD